MKQLVVLAALLAVSSAGCASKPKCTEPQRASFGSDLAFEQAVYAYRDCAGLAPLPPPPPPPAPRTKPNEQSTTSTPGA